jgi:hypothetical protein
MGNRPAGRSTDEVNDRNIQSLKQDLNECLDALSILWHNVAVPCKAADAIEELDIRVPNWKTAPMPERNRDAESHEAMMRMKSWARVRDILLRKGRI